MDLVLAKAAQTHGFVSGHSVLGPVPSQAPAKSSQPLHTPNREKGTHQDSLALPGQGQSHIVVDPMKIVSGAKPRSSHQEHSYHECKPPGLVRASRRGVGSGEMVRGGSSSKRKLA